MKILGCEFVNINSYDGIKCWLNHPVSNEKVFFVPDACHMLKLARNTLGNARAIISTEGAIKWNYFELLYEVQTNLTLKLANKINQNHIMWHQNKMKVKLAAQILSNSTGDALLFFKDIKMEGFQNVELLIFVVLLIVYLIF